MDADDVEFVLGSAPTEVSLTVQEISQLSPNTADETVLNFKKRAVHHFLLDFNNCAPITMNEEGMIKAKQSFYNNDPYFPRPKIPGTEDADLWDIFTGSYLKQAEISANLEAKNSKLPQRFIDLIISDPRNCSTAVSSGPPRSLPPPSLRNPPSSSQAPTLTKDKKNKHRRYVSDSGFDGGASSGTL